jgi:hypothetical protein
LVGDDHRRARGARRVHVFEKIFLRAQRAPR